MLYIKILEIELSGGSSISKDIKCQFYLQNYRGPIKMGLGDMRELEVVPVNFNTKGFNYIIHVPVTPFHNNNKSTIRTLTFQDGFNPNITIFETEIKYGKLPSDIFNSKDLVNSRFIHPLYCFREGDNMQHIYYKKNKEDSHDIFGGNFDETPIPEAQGGWGTILSPTCDAKRTDVID